ncbi:hypothetical protein V1477_017039 [Vespula maculifrons]|uniref:Uncharacterized protein n=1 Tax=Vespula maculifrons TaxID=7453 RepID=A0ABD2B4X1_VESMC
MSRKEELEVEGLQGWEKGFGGGRAENQARKTNFIPGQTERRNIFPALFTLRSLKGSLKREKGRKISRRNTDELARSKVIYTSALRFNGATGGCCNIHLDDFS